MAEQADMAPDGGAVAVRSTPRTTASPEVTGRSPAQARSRLVLPAPLGPTTTTTSPGSTREVDPGKGGEAAGESDGGAELDDRGHGLPRHARGGGYGGSKRRLRADPGPPAEPGPRRGLLRSMEPMLRIQALAIDAHDASALARFWKDALDWRVTEVDEDGVVVIEPRAGSAEDGVSPDLIFLPVPEGKVVKNRLHLDLRPLDQAAEVARLERLGASRVSVGEGDDATWVVMADPEGNEFCVLRAVPAEERSPEP